MDQERLRQLSDQATMRLLNKPGTASSNRGGWMMIATILIEAWDLYAISFLLVFIKVEYNPTAVELGLATAAVQGGALIGALLGGYVADRLGRKRVFIITMILFIVLAIAQGFSMNIWDLIIIRFLLGIPLGSDIANGYAYIMESMSKGAREKMGTRWQFMFGLGEVFAILIITVMYVTGIDHGLLWRIGLALGAIPALVLLLARLDLPETPMSLLHRGQFRKAKQVSHGAVRRPARDAAGRGRAPREAQGRRLPQGDVGRPDQEAGHDLRLDLQRLPGRGVHRVRLLPPGDPGRGRRRRVQQRQHHRHEPGDRGHLRARHHLRLRRAADAVARRTPRAGDVGLRARLHRPRRRRVRPQVRLEDRHRASRPACSCGATTGTPPTA